jgi:hypothetical protein
MSLSYTVNQFFFNISACIAARSEPEPQQNYTRNRTRVKWCGSEFLGIRILWDPDFLSDLEPQMLTTVDPAWIQIHPHNECKKVQYYEVFGLRFSRVRIRNRIRFFSEVGSMCILSKWTGSAKMRLRCAENAFSNIVLQFQESVSGLADLQYISRLADWQILKISV